jgi:hypothetical protein
MKALVTEQQADLDRLNAVVPLMWTMRVRVWCPRCQEVIADVRDPGIPLDHGLVGETIFGAVLTARQYAAERVARIHDPQPGQFTAPGTRFPYDDQYQALIEHRFVGQLPRSLPGFCARHGSHIMDIDQVLDYLRGSRDQRKVLDMRVSRRPSK